MRIETVGVIPIPRKSMSWPRTCRPCASRPIGGGCRAAFSPISF